MLYLRTFGGLRLELREGASDAAIRPRGLALLALMAARPAGLTRDQVVGVLWPDFAPERARHALAQTLYNLRRDLRVDVVRATPAFQLDPSRITSDVAAFHDAVERSDWDAAAGLYAGPFLEGFYLSDALEFEHWVDATRSDFAVAGVRAITALAVQQEREQRLEQAAESWRRLTRLDAYDARGAIGYMESLAALGQRATAIQYGKTYAELLRRELDIEPDAELERLMSRLRSEPGKPALARADAAPEDAAAVVVTDAVGGRLRRASAVYATALILVAVAVIAAAVAVRAGTRRADGPAPVLAVKIRDLTSPDAPLFGGVLNEMLTTSLGRIPTLQVVANSRMLEITMRDRDTGLTALHQAARRAGATEIVEGELIPLPDRRLRLDVRRVDVANGRIRAVYRVTGTDAMTLLDSATVLIADGLGFAPPSGTLADVSTRSPTAYRRYEEGLRAFHQNPSNAHYAYRLFRTAMREDSTFALATYYAWRAAVAIGDPDSWDLGRRATALAARASEHDRLLIRAHVGSVFLDRQAVAVAESLAARYPADPEALVRAVFVLTDVARATDLLNRAIALDSAAGAGPAPVCRLCEALRELVSRYDWADSAAAVERTARRWIRLRPDDAEPWQVLSDRLVSYGRPGEALEAWRRAEALGAGPGGRAPRRLDWALRTDDLAVADRECVSLLMTPDPTDFAYYRWLCLIGLRMAGRYREAAELAREARVPGTGSRRAGVPLDRINDALLDFEMGRPLAAAAKYDALGYGGVDTVHSAAGHLARASAWNLARSLTASVAGGDTARARLLVDSLAAIGRHSTFGRDSLLHYFVRGLLLARAGNHDAAVHAYRAAMSSPAYGYTRINYELSRSLLALGRPAEAVPLLQAVLRGGTQGSGLYLTRTETHELLAHAFERSGQRDSAAAHYTIVERNWRDADPFLRARYQHALASLPPNARVR